MVKGLWCPVYSTDDRWAPKLADY